MTGIVVPPRILAASATGSILTATLIALVFTIGFAIQYGPDPSNLLLFLVALLVGIPVALVLGAPVGFAISWVLWMTGPPAYWRAASAGAITGAMLALATVAAGGSSFEDLWVVAGLPLAGTLSGLAAFRIHFRDTVDPFEG